MIRSVVARAMAVGRFASAVFGLALVVAVVLGVGTVALAAVPGDPFLLGRLNAIDSRTTLAGEKPASPLLRVDNDSAAEGSSALDLRVEPNRAPMTVNSATRVDNLNADQLDGQSADDFVSADKTYTVSDFGVGPGGGSEELLLADCDSGDRLLGGGGGGPFSPDILRFSGPNGQGWKVVAQDNGSGTIIRAEAICADFPPLR